MKTTHMNTLRAILWALIAIYTLLLPYVIFAYNAIVKHFSSAVAGKVPVFILILFGTAYIFVGLFTKKNIRSLVFIVPCAILAYAVIALEPNPNKHIHISEYILMSWLLYMALSIDYKGKGILILVFMCSAMLGIVDELEQGIHPGRFYGWQDMIINSISSLIGVLTILGVKRKSVGDWAWTSSLKKFKGKLSLVLIGSAGAVFTCIYLFQVHAKKIFWSVYPLWLLGWNSCFVTLCIAMVLFKWIHIHRYGKSPGHSEGFNQHSAQVTARLWIFIPLIILFYMHAIALSIALYGWEFI